MIQAKPGVHGGASRDMIRRGSGASRFRVTLYQVQGSRSTVDQCYQLRRRDRLRQHLALIKR